jgi:hypothetical protein
MRVGDCLGVLELVTCDRAAHCLVQAGIGYLCLDLRADLFNCVNPALRQPWLARCRGFRRRLARTPLGNL